jgi:Leucine-rich repeat (LRR) protein
MIKGLKKLKNLKYLSMTNNNLSSINDDCIPKTLNILNLKDNNIASVSL